MQSDNRVTANEPNENNRTANEKTVNEKTAVKILITSNSGDDFHREEVIGSLLEKNGSLLVQYTDSSDIKTSIKLGGDEIHLLRSGGHVNHRLKIKSGERTVGVMGENPFFIEGHRADWNFDGECGEIRLGYTLPDISDEPMHFSIRIKFSADS